MVVGDASGEKENVISSRVNSLYVSRLTKNWSPQLSWGEKKEEAEGWVRKKQKKKNPP